MGKKPLTSEDGARIRHLCRQALDVFNKCEDDDVATSDTMQAATELRGLLFALQNEPTEPKKV